MSAARSPRPGPRSDEVLLFQRTPFGESSLVVHGLGRRAGRVHLLARGAYRPTSGYFALLDLFDTLALDWRERAASDLSELTGGSLAVRRRHVVGSLDAYRAALGVLELAELAARPGVRVERLFDRVAASLDALNGAGRREAAGEGAAAPEVDLVRATFDLVFLDELGLAPALVACASCGRPAPTAGAGRPRTAFAPALGGRLCAACAGRGRAEGARVREVESALLELAAALAARVPAGGFASLEAAAPAGTLTPARRRALVRLVQSFLEHHLELRPKSRGAAPA